MQVCECGSVPVCECGASSRECEWQFPREVSGSSHSSTPATTQVAQKEQLDKWRKGHQSWSQGFFWPLCQLISIYFCQSAGSWEEGSLGARRSEALEDLQPIVSLGGDLPLTNVEGERSREAIIRMRSFIFRCLEILSCLQEILSKVQDLWC